ncbi:MAG: RDD family protein [Acidimicrobiales bacterium]|nr:RDD family protein [Acidimicrobiales bacterium]
MAGAMARPTGPRANFGQRLVASLIDGTLVVIVWFVLTLALDQVGLILSVLAALAYYAYLEGSPSGQTLGKRVMDIRVIDAETGEPIGYGRAVLRFFSRFLSSLLCALGYFWMLWDPNKQTWHDKITADVVVPTEAYPVEAWPG